MVRGMVMHCDPLFYLRIGQNPFVISLFLSFFGNYFKNCNHFDDWINILIV